MAQPSFGWQDLEDFSLLAADAPWSEFLLGLREVSAETFDLHGPVDDWLGFVRQWDRTGSGRTWYVVGGEHEGRSYALVGIGALANPDRITALASQTGGTVLGYNYLDMTADATLTAARGATLLRFTVESNFGNHSEGERLPGEPGDGLPHMPSDFASILRAHGFDADAWLARDQKWGLIWTMLDAKTNPEAHRRLYFGPLRMRIDHIEQAALADMMDEEAP
ncbi:MAG: hypothetical protein JOZ87_00925 [Chloroflexi bacterium]|nr:hypothetical protein [Chloroflexota bacterium]